MKTPSKEEIKEEAKIYRINEHDDGAFCGFIAGAEWMQEQLDANIAPQSGEVMTLEDIYAKMKDVCPFEIHSMLKPYIKELAELYASQFKTKSDQLQSELVDFKDNWFIVTRKYESLEDENLNLKSELEQVKSERNALMEALGVNNPWPVTDVLNLLSESTNTLLNTYNYDRQGWEDISHCAKLGKTMSDNILKNLQSTKL